MTHYVLEFEWRDAVNPQDDACRPLDAKDFEGAKLEAALFYAVAEFSGVAPTAYRILAAADREEVYRYPVLSS